MKAWNECTDTREGNQRLMLDCKMDEDEDRMTKINFHVILN